MLIGTPIDACNTHYAQTTQLFMVREPFSCCRDVIVPDYKETASQCLLGLPSAARFGIELEALPPIGFKLPHRAR